MEKPRGWLILSSSQQCILVPHKQKEMAWMEAHSTVKHLIQCLELTHELAETLERYQQEIKRSSASDFEFPVLKKYKEWA